MLWTPSNNIFKDEKDYNEFNLNIKNLLEKFKLLPIKIHLILRSVQEILINE